MNQLNQMLQQAQKMQTQMAQVQEKLSQVDVMGSAGAGLVEVVVSGRGDVRRVKIDKSLATPDEVDVLEDLIVAAFNDAKSKAEQKMSEEMGKITAGLGLPAGMQLPF